jgi:hypothetical protein
MIFLECRKPWKRFPTLIRSLSASTNPVVSRRLSSFFDGKGKLLRPGLFLIAAQFSKLREKYYSLPPGLYGESGTGTETPGKRYHRRVYTLPVLCALQLDNFGTLGLFFPGPPLPPKTGRVSLTWYARPEGPKPQAGTPKTIPAGRLGKLPPFCRGRTLTRRPPVREY